MKKIFDDMDKGGYSYGLRHGSGHGLLFRAMVLGFGDAAAVMSRARSTVASPAVRRWRKPCTARVRWTSRLWTIVMVGNASAMSKLVTQLMAGTQRHNARLASRVAVMTGRRVLRVRLRRSLNSASGLSLAGHNVRRACIVSTVLLYEKQPRFIEAYA